MHQAPLILLALDTRCWGKDRNTRTE